VSDEAFLLLEVLFPAAGRLGRGAIWEAAPNLNLRSGWCLEGLFTRVFKGGGLKIVDKSGRFGPESIKAEARRIN
jgi:hypothetical protein